MTSFGNCLGLIAMAALRADGPVRVTKEEGLLEPFSVQGLPVFEMCVLRWPEQTRASSFDSVPLSSDVM